MHIVCDAAGGLLKYLFCLRAEKIDLPSEETWGPLCSACMRRFTGIISPVTASNDMAAPTFHTRRTRSSKGKRRGKSMEN